MQLSDLVKLVNSKDTYLGYDFDLYRIYNGDLLRYVEAALQEQLSEQSYAQARHRIPPINILRKVVDKLSKVYSTPPQRSLIGGNSQEEELFFSYLSEMQINRSMTLANAYFNLTKRAFIEPYLYKPSEDLPGVPRLRVIPSHRILPISYDSSDPTVMNAAITFEGTYTSGLDGKPVKYFKYTDDSRFIYFDADGKDVTQKFAPESNPAGINIYGKLPYIYINRSFDQILPVQDTDVKRMAILIPTLFADTNYASMFQAFSILYGIDVSDQGLKMSPNAFWSFKSEVGIDGKPQVGSIKPDMDVDGSLNLIASQLAFWLNSKNIRPGAIGDISASNFSSGISKIIDEADTTDDKKEQVPYFENAEIDLYELLMYHMHPVWVAGNMIENRTFFRPTTNFKVEFVDQLPMTSRADVIANVTSELSAGLIDRKRAIKRLNPTMTDEEIEEMMLDIKSNNTIEVSTNDLDEN